MAKADSDTQGLRRVEPSFSLGEQQEQQAEDDTIADRIRKRRRRV